MTKLLGVDTGGTFTDLIAQDAKTGELGIAKSLSTPADPSEAIFRAIDKSNTKAREIEYARSCGRPDEEAGLLRLKTEAGACAPLEDYLVSAGRRTALPVDEEWLERVAGTADDASGGRYAGGVSP